MLAFLSYQTEERIVAGQVAKLLTSLGVDTFTAHDDVEVSLEWRGELLKKIGAATCSFRSLVLAITSRFGACKSSASLRSEI
jgi:hypothetical protein